MRAVLDLNILPEKPVDALHRRPGFKASGFKLTLFSERNVNM
jgi:hypothetical protein